MAEEPDPIEGFTETTPSYVVGCRFFEKGDLRIELGYGLWLTTSRPYNVYLRMSGSTLDICRHLDWCADLHEAIAVRDALADKLLAGRPIAEGRTIEELWMETLL